MIWMINEGEVSSGSTQEARVRMLQPKTTGDAMGSYYQAHVTVAEYFHIKAIEEPLDETVMKKWAVCISRTICLNKKLSDFPQKLEGSPIFTRDMLPMQ